MTRLGVNLLIDGNKAVKGTQFSNYWYVGDPINSVRIFSELEVDEILVTDISASNHKCINYDLMAKLVTQSSAPISYVGGITKITEVDRLIAMGFDRIGLNKNRHDVKLVEQIVGKYGKQAIIGCLDVIETDNEYLVYDRYHQSIETKNSVLKDLQKMQEYGFGELLINNITKDGMLTGFTMFYFEWLASQLAIGLAIAGGYNSYNDYEVCKNTPNIKGVYVGHKFVSLGGKNRVLLNYTAS